MHASRVVFGRPRAIGAAEQRLALPSQRHDPWCKNCKHERSKGDHRDDQLTCTQGAAQSDNYSAMARMTEKIGRNKETSSRNEKQPLKNTQDPPAAPTAAARAATATMQLAGKNPCLPWPKTQMKMCLERVCVFQTVGFRSKGC